MRHQWSRLNRIQKGTFGEYVAKMEFAMYGFAVFTSEVDDHGVDFVVQNATGDFYEVQVKTITGHNLAYVNANKFKCADRFLITLVQLQDGAWPELFLFKGTDWDDPSGLLRYNPYEGKQSEPAYEIHLSEARRSALEDFAFDRVVKLLSPPATM